MSTPEEYIPPEDRPRINEEAKVREIADLLRGVVPDDVQEAESESAVAEEALESESTETHPLDDADDGADETAAADADEEAEAEEGDEEEGPEVIPDDALEALAVTVGDEQVTVAELLEQVKSAGDLEARAAAFDERKHEHDLAAMQQRREVDALLGVLRDAQIPEEVIRAAQGRQADYDARQRAQLLEAWPEMASETYRAEQRERLAEAGSRYGYTRAEVMATTDARALMVLRRLADADESRANAAARLKHAAQHPGAEKRAAGRARRDAAAKAGAKAVIERARKSSDVSDKALGVAALIAEGSQS